VTHLHFKSDFVALLYFFLHVRHVGKNALATVDVTNESEAFVWIEHGHFAMAGFVHRLHILILRDADLNVLKVDLFPLRWVRGGVHDSTELVDIGNHIGTVQGELVAFGFELLGVLFLLFLGAFGFSLALPESFL